MKQLVLPFQQAQFNGLPSIEEADANIKAANKLELAIAVLGPIFLKHKMHKSWGISLLHKHFELEENEMPIQELHEGVQFKSYITTPKDRSYAAAFYPAIIQIDNFDSLIPLEFSTDTSALVANRDLAKNPMFVKELRDALVENQLTKDFGLVYGKEFNNSYELVEFNYSSRISVLEETLPAEIDYTKLIQTSWFFSPDARDTSCKTKCMSACSVSSSGSHTRSHSVYHDPNG